MSFSMTKPQFRDRTKTVTRRLGWENLEPGEHFLGIEQGQGMKKGERQIVMGECVAVDVRRERVDVVTMDDVIKEGFPLMTADGFVAFFCKGHRCAPSKIITRIEFQYVEAADG